jgi:hypothetical protein
MWKYEVVLAGKEDDFLRSKTGGEYQFKMGICQFSRFVLKFAWQNCQSVKQKYFPMSRRILAKLCSSILLLI